MAFRCRSYILLNTAIQPSITASFTESDMIIDYVRVYQEGTASVKEDASLDAIKVYPNPVVNNVTIQVHPNLIGVKGSVYSLLERKLPLSFKMHQQKNTIYLHLTKVFTC